MRLNTVVIPGFDPGTSLRMSRRLLNEVPGSRPGMTLNL